MYTPRSSFLRERPACCVFCLLKEGKKDFYAGRSGFLCYHEECIEMVLCDPGHYSNYQIKAAIEIAQCLKERKGERRKLIREALEMCMS